MLADRYEIRRVIGRGGMGQVYLARDRATAQDVALKTVNSECLANPDVMARFEREVELARQLDHPGIIKFHNTHNWNGILFYTMEHIEGKTLRVLLSEQRRLEFRRTVRVICGVCDALEHAHRITIHRDLSPENIMVLEDGSVRLLDFGLAKIADRFKGLTMTGTNLGKARYMAPEQESNAAGVDHRADLYSLGVIFYEALAGQTPKPGGKLTQFRLELPPEADAFVQTALARNPGERFRSAGEFRNALRQLEQRAATFAAAAPKASGGLFARSIARLRGLLRSGPRREPLADDRRALPDASIEPATATVCLEDGETVGVSDPNSLQRAFFCVSGETVADCSLREVQMRLAAVYAANQAIASERELSRVFDRIMDHVFALLPVDNGVILLGGSKRDEPRVEYIRSKSGSKEVCFSTTIVRRAFEKGEAIITRNALNDSRFDSGVSIIAQNISSAMCAPLTHQDDRLGVLYVDNHGIRDAFTDSDLELLAALAGSAASAIKNAQYLRMVEQSCQDTLVVLANAIELRDQYTVGHTRRVTSFAVEIARELGWDAARLVEVKMGGVLHDVGKIAVDNAILGKPGPLTGEETSRMKVHPGQGANLVRDVSFLKPVIPYCLYHHERWDGTGYPFGLKADAIPIEGRLVAVADAFDAMTSDRPYRKAVAFEAALQALAEGRGTQFDPAIVDALLACYGKGRITQALQDYYKNETPSIACPFCSTFVHPVGEITVGSELDCPVCCRRIRIVEKGRLCGELVPRV